MQIAYLDCFAGISGDMFLGALLDAGVPLAVLEEAVVALDLGASLRVGKVDRSGIASIKVDVLEGGELAESTHVQDHQPGAPAAHVHSHEDSHNHTHTHPHEHPHTHHAPDPHHTEVHSHSHTHDHESGLGHTHNHPHVHGRSLSAIRELLRAAPLTTPVKQFAIRTFELLGESEAKIHNVPVEQIHFHEVGAVDAIVDIVAVSAGIAYLERDGPLAWSCSHINVGGGMVVCAHGNFPVPAPATADLLRGMPTYSAHLEKELVTPTGAALLRALNPAFGPQPAVRVATIGYGAGTRNPEGFPNVLRLSIGEAVTDAPEPSAHQARTALQSHTGDTVVVFEAAIDDATPQLLADVAERALHAGALDVMQTPVVMKKGRAATMLTVLANPQDASALERLLLSETTTLGLRIHHEQRSCLARRHESVVTAYGNLRIKVGSLRGEDLNAAPEFEDCRAAARTYGVPLKQVLQAAVAAYAESRTSVGAR